jgi:hypothetical protein
MEVARGKYRVFAKEFLISPTKLDDITNFSGTQPPESSAAASG